MEWVTEDSQWVSTDSQWEPSGQTLSVPVARVAVVGLAPVGSNIAVPVARISISGLRPQLSVVQVPVARVAVSGRALRVNLAIIPSLATVGASPHTPAYVTGITVPQALVSISPLRPTHYWAADPAQVQTIYQFVLTGSADGETDITIPISSCQMRRRNGSPTYMSVVVPDYDTYAPEVQARLNGEMVFYKGVRFSDGSTQVQEIARVDHEMENLRMDKGPKSRSITMVGHRTVTITDPNVVTLSGASYRNYSGGIRRYRCDVDLWLRPGDTAVIEGEDEQVQVGYISYTIGVGREQMEVVEVEG